MILKWYHSYYETDNAQYRLCYARLMLYRATTEGFRFRLGNGRGAEDTKAFFKKDPPRLEQRRSLKVRQRAGRRVFLVASAGEDPAHGSDPDLSKYNPVEQMRF
jgi:hypothetical protein